MWTMLCSRCTKKTSTTWTRMNADIKTMPIKCSDRAPWCPPNIFTNHGKRTRMAGDMPRPVTIMKGATMKMTKA